MKTVLSVIAFCVFLGFINAKESPPKVQVYSRNPGQHGKDNTLICHVSGFHPPDISIQLLKNGVEIPDAKQTDLAFEQGWQFHLTKSVGFTPASGEVYTCRVRHLKNLKTYTWGELLV
ncbi:beta-2-microglobulin-like [Oncorhynchus masou masou]|uniref:beta-2-microglobulin-like n=1 Tax=Oncorhynchus masou masou TaxID=90313 RepID=UPI00318439DC